VTADAAGSSSTGHRLLHVLGHRTAFDGAFLLACVVAFALLLYLGRDLTFFGDEWTWIEERADWTWDAFMQPHNEHWSLGLAVAYKPLLATVGLRSYVPYLTLLILLHIATAAALYWHVRRQVGPIAAVAASVVFLFLGAGSDNLFWAFQIGFVGATAAGAWALVLLLDEPTPRPWLIAGLLLAGVATAGMGLFFLAASLAVVVISPAKRRLAWVLLPAGVAYGAWLLLLGGKAVQQGPPDLQALLQYVRLGVAHATGSVRLRRRDRVRRGRASDGGHRNPRPGS